MMMPHTNPSISSKSQVEYVLKQAAGHPVKLIPAGSLSAHVKGEELSEMFDMFSHGALAFTDGKQKVSSGLLSRALLYTREFGARIITYPSDSGFYGGNGQVNEGFASTFTGLKGMPAVAEEAGVARDLYLSAYNNTPIHLTNISGAGSVGLIRKARQSGVAVTAAVSWMNLCFTEERLLEFNQQYKVYPPLRSANDRTALITALQDGVISAIISDHMPLEIESKEVEFDDAGFGVRGLEGMFAALCTFVPELPLATVVKALTTGPASVLGIPSATVTEGNSAELTLFCPHEKWTFTEADVPYGYANTPLLGMELTGKVKRIVG
jgi:dihydroorotase